MLKSKMEAALFYLFLYMGECAVGSGFDGF